MAFAFVFAARDGMAFYNPSSGRWLSRDSITEAGFNLTREAKSVDPEWITYCKLDWRACGNATALRFQCG